MFQWAYWTNNDAFLYNTNTGQGYAYPYDQSIDPYAQQNLGQQDYNQQNYNQQAYYDPSQGQNYPPPWYPQGQNYSQPNYNQQQCCPTHLAKEWIRGMTR